MSAKEIVKITRNRYVLDWFDHKDIEINLNDHSYFIFEYRLGSWFLLSRFWDKKEQEWVDKIGFNGDSFDIASPRDAFLKLNKKVRSIRCLHETGPNFIREAAGLFSSVNANQLTKEGDA